MLLLLLLLQDSVHTKKFTSPTIDSTVVTSYYNHPPPPPPSSTGRGVALASWHVPPDSLSPRSYNGTTINGSSSIKPLLDRVKQLKGKAAISVGRTASQVNKQLSVKAACDDIAKWPDLTPYKDVVLTVIVSDDISGKDIWGPNAPYYARIDSIARCSKLKWSWLPTSVRQKPSSLNYSYKWRWLDNGWAQYDSPYRDGSVTSYITTQLASAKLRGLGVIFGMNYLDGGDGSSKILGTYEDAAKYKRYQMSGKEISTVGRKLSQYTCFLAGWTYSLNWTGTAPNRTAAQIAGIKGFDRRADVKVGLVEVRAVADTTTFKPCYLRP